MAGAFPFGGGGGGGPPYAPVDAGGGGRAYTGEYWDPWSAIKGWVDPGSEVMGKGLISLQEFPEFVITSRGMNEVVIMRSSGSVGGDNEWSILQNGMIVKTQAPHMALAVDGLAERGNKLILQDYRNNANTWNKWRMNQNGMIVLERAPGMDINVFNNTIQDGQPLVIWDSNRPQRNNKWKAPGGDHNAFYEMEHMGKNQLFVLRVIGTRGNPNTVWSAITGSLEIRTGYLASAKGLRRTDERDRHSNYLYVDDDLGKEFAAVLSKVPVANGGHSFLLKVQRARSDRRSAQTGFLACHEFHPTDKRDEVSTYAFVHENQQEAAVFEEEDFGSGFLLKVVGSYGGAQHHKLRTGYLTAVQSLDPDQRGPDSSYAYVTADQGRKLAAVFDYEDMGRLGWWKRLRNTDPRYLAAAACACLALLAIIIWILVLVLTPSDPRGSQITVIVPTQAPGVVAPSQESLQIRIPYNCEHKDDVFWSNAKKSWCCTHFNLACTTPPPTTTFTIVQTTRAPLMWVSVPTPPKNLVERGPPYNCYANVLNWQTWDNRKQDWCCSNHGVACSATARSKAFDCDAGYSNWMHGWSARKKMWCCMHENRACPAHAVEDFATTSYPYDCTAGYSNWRMGWSEGKKTWCCSKQGVACEVTDEPDEPNEHLYDCDAGFANWESRWTEAKQVWCCFHQQRACSAESGV
eukprot:TRINITY_DN108702_c0_g1_i1.p1 TRINITY_DN108702_c0_g1~~TRINITY_DN108702_c0_g1_i1.p1  ORF type:complete len:689 (-),score=96.76 TRINITY_DN108702_c0_g1_i1:137-2203(-)